MEYVFPLTGLNTTAFVAQVGVPLSELPVLSPGMNPVKVAVRVGRGARVGVGIGMGVEVELQADKKQANRIIRV